MLQELWSVFSQVLPIQFRLGLNQAIELTNGTLESFFSLLQATTDFALWHGALSCWNIYLDCSPKKCQNQKVLKHL